MAHALRATITQQEQRISELEHENARLRRLLAMGRRRPQRSPTMHETSMPKLVGGAYNQPSHEREGTPPPPSTPPPTCDHETPSRNRTLTWLKQRRDHHTASVWLVHDNRPLASTMGELMSTGKPAEILIETKRGRTLCFVLGQVAFAGAVDDDEAQTSGMLRAGSRGAYCFRLAPCRAQSVDPDVERYLPPGSRFTCLPLNLTRRLSSRDEIVYFFTDCPGRVDVILSPQRLNDNGKPCEGRPAASCWLPYWDTDDPPRKIAPQFRSAGVGYIRLGDDMAQHGLAFVSADGATFLDDSISVQPGAHVETVTPKSTPRLRATYAYAKFEDDESGIANSRMPSFASTTFVS